MLIRMCAGKVESATKDDPMLICNAYKTQRIYFYTRREPDTELYVFVTSCGLCGFRFCCYLRSHHPLLLHLSAPDGTGRDVFDEKPTREDRAMASSAAGGSAAAVASMAGRQVTLHTTMGDIGIELLPE